MEASKRLVGVWVLHFDDGWTSASVEGVFSTPDAAKSRAERLFTVDARNWVETDNGAYENFEWHVEQWYIDDPAIG
jgi:hypothetical protein